MLVFRICGALCFPLSPFLFRGSEVCFYAHFGYLVYSSTVFNLCVADIHILYFKHVSIRQLRPNCAFIYTPVLSYMRYSLFLQFHCHKVDCIDQLFSSLAECKGLSDFRKRRTIFVSCRKRNADFFFLQETHSTIATENQWKNEWDAEMITSHGGSNSRGVTILIKNGFDCTIYRKILDPLGRYIILKAQI